MFIPMLYPLLVLIALFFFLDPVPLRWSVSHSNPLNSILTISLDDTCVCLKFCSYYSLLTCLLASRSERCSHSRTFTVDKCPMYTNAFYIQLPVVFLTFAPVSDSPSGLSFPDKYTFLRKAVDDRVNPLERGSSSKKFVLIECQGRPGIGSGCTSP